MLTGTVAPKNLYPPPGRLVNLGTHRLHLNCVGQDAPTVVFEAALGASSLSWSLVQPVISRMTRACAYDRAGFGWSDAGPLPRTADRLADELHALLRRGLAHGPYVLVGHSFGGLVIRAFRARYPGLSENFQFQTSPSWPDEITTSHRTASDF